MIGVGLAIWRRRRRLATMLACTLLACAATLALSLPGMHRATATLLLEHPGAPEGPGRPTGSDLETRLHTITEEVLSRSRLEALMDRFDLYPDLRSKGNRRAAVDRFWGDIQVKFKRTEPGIGRGTTIAVGVSVHGRDAETVAHVANALAAGYLDENLRFRERGRLVGLRQELVRMQQVYSDKYPDVIRLQAELATVERQLADGSFERAPQKTGNSLHRLDASAQPEPKHDRSRGEEFRLLDPAMSDGKTAAPNRIRLVLLGVLFTIGTTVAAVLLAERLDASFHTVDELRTFTKIPVLAQIPNIAVDADADPWRRWSTVAWGAAGLALVVLVSYYFAHGNEQLVWMLSGWRLRGHPLGPPAAF